MAGSFPTRAVIVALVAVVFAYLQAPNVHRKLTVLGVLRTPTRTPVADDDFTVIQDTTHCEDLHHHAPTKRLFAACEDSPATRHAWFPPLGTYENASAVQDAAGGLFYFGPGMTGAYKLELDKFDGPFVTHGIDVITDTGRPRGKAVYIFAVNHLPNPDYYGPYPHDQAGFRPTSSAAPRSRSQIEIFHHTIGRRKAFHIRSVRHPLITTPNDVLAVSPTEFYVTNDHRHTAGLRRGVEDLYAGATWSNTLHVQLEGLYPSDAPTDGVNVQVALDKQHNNNGLGHGPAPDDVLVVNCMSGLVRVGKLPAEAGDGPRRITVNESIAFASQLDNPSYFTDPYADDALDASGIVVAGMAKPFVIGQTRRDPNAAEGVMVWYAKPRPGGGWDQRLLFQDDGSRIRDASTAVLVAIHPDKEGGRRRAWLYVTGFMSANIISVKVDL